MDKKKTFHFEFTIEGIDRERAEVIFGAIVDIFGDDVQIGGGFVEVEEDTEGGE